MSSRKQARPEPSFRRRWNKFDHASMRDFAVNEKAKVSLNGVKGMYFENSNSVFQSPLWVSYLADTYPSLCCGTPFTLRLHRQLGVLHKEAYVVSGSPFRKVPIADVHAYLVEHKLLEGGRFILFPTTLVYMNKDGDVYNNHQLVFMIDVAGGDTFFIDPMNNGKIRTHDEMTHDDVATETQNICEILSKTIMNSDIFGERFERPTIDASMAMLDVNLLLEAKRPDAVDDGYCSPLTFYIVNAILLYWPLLSTDSRFRDTYLESPTELLSVLIHHFVCRSFATSYPPTVKYIDSFLESTAGDTDVLDFTYQPRSISFAADCIRTKDPWKGLDAFVFYVVQKFLEKKLLDLKGWDADTVGGLIFDARHSKGWKDTVDANTQYDFTFHDLGIQGVMNEVLVHTLSERNLK